MGAFQTGFGGTVGTAFPSAATFPHYAIQQGIPYNVYGYECALLFSLSLSLSLPPSRCTIMRMARELPTHAQCNHLTCFYFEKYFYISLFYLSTRKKINYQFYFSYLNIIKDQNHKTDTQFLFIK